MKGKLAVRLTGMIILGLVGSGIGMSLRDVRGVSDYETWVVLGTSVLGAFFGFLFTPYTLVPVFRWALRGIVDTPIRTLITGTLGLAVGLVIAILILLAFSVSDLPEPWNRIVPVLVSVTAAFLGVMTAVLRERDLSQLIGIRDKGAPQGQPIQVRDSGQNGKAILVDTSAIIDGRIADITQTGFVEGGLLIPKFVLEEIQHIADSSDALRRNRGRRGLEVLNQLQKDAHVRVEIIEAEVPGSNGVDSKLVSLAKHANYPILTTDFNLNKVAELQGVKVLNINELANSLKPIVLPGEELLVHITQEGKEEGQGVGFLDDGTMMVVEGGKRYINSQLPVVITRVLQTSAGRIIFAHLK